MFRKKYIGWILFAGGMLLQELSYLADIWMIRMLGGILWPIGMVMCINSMIIHHQERRREGPLKPSDDCENS